MDINFTIDDDLQKIDIVLDNSMTLEAYLDDDDDMHYIGFDDLKDEDVEDALKKVCRILCKLI